MKKEIAERWVAALRSGEYKQTKNILGRVDGDEKYYCCLGVLCELAVEDGIIPPASIGHDECQDTDDLLVFDGNDKEPGRDVIEWAGMRSRAGVYRQDGSTTISGDTDRGCLASDNDSGKSFAEIANIIEREVDNL
jgi:hypothetical protein